MNSPLIWRGNFARFLRAQLDLFGAAYILTGSADPTSVATDAPAGSLYLRSTGDVYKKDDNGSTTNWTLLGSGSVTSQSTVRFTLSGATVPYECIDGGYRAKGNNTIASVDMSMLNSGTAGDTEIQVNQWRAGVLFDSATASLTASGGNPIADNVTLSGSLSVQADDLITVDVLSKADGNPSELSVELIFT